MLQRQAKIILTSSSSSSTSQQQQQQHHPVRDVAKMVVSAVRNQSPPGRFLREDKVSGLWYDAGDEDAVSRTVRILRKLLKHNSPPSPPPPPASIARGVVVPANQPQPQAVHQATEAQESNQKCPKQQQQQQVTNKPSRFHDEVLHLLDDAWTHDEEDLNSKLCEYYRNHGRMDQRSNNGVSSTKARRRGSVVVANSANSSASGMSNSSSSSVPMHTAASMHQSMHHHSVVTVTATTRLPPSSSRSAAQNTADNNKRRRDDDHERNAELEHEQQQQQRQQQGMDGPNDRVSEPPKNAFKRRMAVRRLSTPAA
mmetsp:Transcript_1035/g.1624  ORF Transcript_1035/g.1624 Transcript_1035/m.1624 type:complete len:312 (+) Transcript_1035:240-1175(+)